jgi:CheY-like chemotaxis protein
MVWNGVQAVEASMAEYFDVILMDIQMPVMDGLEATQQIRRSENLVPIVGVTAHAMLDDHKRFMASGMNALVVKPIHRQELVETIMRCLPAQQRPSL